MEGVKDFCGLVLVLVLAALAAQEMGVGFAMAADDVAAVEVVVVEEEIECDARRWRSEW